LTPAELRRLVNREFWEADGEHTGPSAAFFRARVNDSKLDCHPDRVTLIHHSGGNS
jgi:hypothetical protein